MTEFVLIEERPYNVTTSKGADTARVVLKMLNLKERTIYFSPHPFTYITEKLASTLPHRQKGAYSLAINTGRKLYASPKKEKPKNAS